MVRNLSHLLPPTWTSGALKLLFESWWSISSSGFDVFWATPPPNMSFDGPSSSWCPRYSSPKHPFFDTLCSYRIMFFIDLYWTWLGSLCWHPWFTPSVLEVSLAHEEPSVFFCISKRRPLDIVPSPSLPSSSHYEPPLFWYLVLIPFFVCSQYHNLPITLCLFLVEEVAAPIFVFLRYMGPSEKLKPPPYVLPVVTPLTPLPNFLSFPLCCLSCLFKTVNTKYAPEPLMHCFQPYHFVSTFKTNLTKTPC